MGCRWSPVEYSLIPQGKKLSGGEVGTKFWEFPEWFFIDRIRGMRHHWSSVEYSSNSINGIFSETCICPFSCSTVNLQRADFTLSTRVKILGLGFIKERLILHKFVYQWTPQFHVYTTFFIEHSFIHWYFRNYFLQKNVFVILYRNSKYYYTW